MLDLPPRQDPHHPHGSTIDPVLSPHHVCVLVEVGQDDPPPHRLPLPLAHHGLREVVLEPVVPVGLLPEVPPMEEEVWLQAQVLCIANDVGHIAEVRKEAAQHKVTDEDPCYQPVLLPLLFRGGSKRHMEVQREQR
eukprot:749601-Hanusia_phi.AAC.3